MIVNSSADGMRDRTKAPHLLQRWNRAALPPPDLRNSDPQAGQVGDALPVERSLSRLIAAHLLQLYSLDANAARSHASTFTGSTRCAHGSEARALVSGRAGHNNEPSDSRALSP